MKVFLSLSVILLIASSAFAQDTTRVSIQEFIETGLENSGQVSYEQENVSLAENDIRRAQSNRFLPQFELSTQHGVVPGVKSNNPDLPENEYYLDPDLENDWQDWAVFTRAEVNAVQPVFTWGALKNVVNASQSAAKAAKERFESEKSDIALQLYELYNSYLLSLEVSRLLDDASSQIDEIEQLIEEQEESGELDVDESELYKFDIFKSEFAIQAAEVEENTRYIQNIWNYVMQAEEGEVYEPDARFLDPVENDLEELDYYRTNALEYRSELQAIDAGIEAADFGVKATKAQNYPSLFLGISGSFANTPNRPRQSNPFIINNTNYASAAVGIGIRQNLDFLSVKNDVERSRIQRKQAEYLKDAAKDGIVLEIGEKYKEASLANVKVEQTDQALVTAKRWLRQEQLDYDFGTGDTKDLVDALKQELELRVELKRVIFEFNQNMAELWRVSGMDILNLNINN